MNIITKGTTILTERPFVYVLKNSERHIRCNYCFMSRMNLKKCTGCQYLVYCDRVCQKRAWSIHKLECKKVRIVNREIPESALLLFRIYLKLKDGGEGIKSYYSENECRQFSHLMNHENNIRNDATRMEQFSTLFVILQRLLQDDNLNGGYLLQLFGQLCINTFNILDESLVTLGSGIYLAASSLDHSCKPNAVTIFEGPNLCVRTVEDILDYAWSKVRITYINIMNLTEDRQKKLQSAYYFTCDCIRCNDSMEYELMNSIKCPLSSCSGIIPIVNAARNFNCLTCDTSIPEERITTYYQIVDETKSIISYESSVPMETAYKPMKNLSEAQQDILSSLNVYRVITLERLLDMCILLEKFDEADAYAFELLISYRRYHGEYHPLLTVLYLKLAKLLALKDDFKATYDILAVCKQNIKISHGFDHSIYKTLLSVMESVNFSQT